MSLLDDILSWSINELKPWQRDALRRLFEKQDLNPQDFDDIYWMLKSAHGLNDPQNRNPVPFDKKHIPAMLESETPVIILAMRDLKHVNRIARGQKLMFAEDGITVIYGGNASGKSGYARVLKRACRARDVNETVHPNAFDAASSTSVPEATFDIVFNGKVKPLCWKRDEIPPDELSTISVFDGRSARAYLDNEQDVAYLPYGLDMVQNLGQIVLPEMGRRLDAEINMININTSAFADLKGETTVGKMINNLSASSDISKLKDLANITDEEINRLMELDKVLSENDPSTAAKLLRLQAQRFSGLISRIDSASSCVDDAAEEKLRVCDKEAEAASAAELISAVRFQSGEKLLPGTGEKIWQNLFEAARNFSTTVAYPDKPFPHLDDGALCPLCQQSFDQEAEKRMRRFENFVKQHTAQIANGKREQRENKKKKLKESSVSFGLDAATTEEIRQLNVQLLQAIQDFENKVQNRKTWLLTAMEEHVWNVPPPLNNDPRPNLKLLESKSLSQADDLNKAANEIQKNILQTQRLELRARANLALRLSGVLDLVNRMQIDEKLKKCKNDLKTKAISDKAKEFASQAVTATLQDALNTEFKTLGVNHVKIKLNERADRGKMKHKLVLDLPLTNRMKLDEVLSEGEQRAIALGSFLAELHLAEHKGGIVFDDPVSSLDHNWRKRVASRLVSEAKNRQVIVFTHDTIFLSQLHNEIKQQNVNHLFCHLEWMNDQSGNISSGLPWEHQKYKDRIDKLEKAQKELFKNWPAYPNESDRDKMREQYNRLRATIERVIQDVVFNGVVQRYHDYVRVNNLSDVAGLTDIECNNISELYKTCCDVVSAHDPSSAANTPVPDATQLGQDIDSLKSIINAIKARRNAHSQTSAIP